MTTCANCEERIWDPSKAYEEYVGWARPGGKAAQMFDRKPTGRLLCVSCGMRLDQGLVEIPGQTTIEEALK